MNSVYQVIPVSDLRYKAKDILLHLQKEPVVLTQRGRATAVLISFDDYNTMANRLQELEKTQDETLLLFAQAHLQEMEFVGVEALEKLYQEKIGGSLSAKS